MTHSASTLVHDDISDHPFVTMSAIGVAGLVVRVIGIIPHASRDGADVLSAAQLSLN